MSECKDSPAIRLLQLIWDEEGHQMGHSWERLNSALSMALSLAIRHGLRFDRDDFDRMARSPRDGGFNFGYWAGADGHMLGEWFYSLACNVSRCGGSRGHGPNRSAAIAFERWKGRKPFVIQERGHSPQRIAVGFQFRWCAQGWPVGELVSCTSFSADGAHLVTCTYDGESSRQKVARRCRITHEDLRLHHQRLKETGAEQDKARRETA